MWTVALLARSTSFAVWSRETLSSKFRSSGWKAKSRIIFWCSKRKRVGWKSTEGSNRTPNPANTVFPDCCETTWLTNKVLVSKYCLDYSIFWNKHSFIHSFNSYKKETKIIQSTSSFYLNIKLERVIDSEYIFYLSWTHIFFICHSKRYISQVYLRMVQWDIVGKNIYN